MDISHLRERELGGPVTVTELNNFIKSVFDSNRALASVTVRGEISNFKRHSSGHLYFSLKDEGGQIRAVMFRARADYLRFDIENGMRVIVHGTVSVYTRDGAYQLYASSIQPDGIGALYLAFSQMKERLSKEGLFDEAYKKPIPSFPAAIGVITSPTGAAVRDIINVLGRRYPIAKVYLYPALVQGDGAEDSLILALDYFETSGLVDTIIIGRGGGSIEDLWCFNSEKLARRIFNAKTPIISAVGHETDFTICDFVADMRAPTPSAAAEVAVPDIRSVMETVDRLQDRCTLSLLRIAERSRERLSRVMSKDVIASKTGIIDVYRERLSDITDELSLRFSELVKDNKHNFATLVSKISALSPIDVLSRGYSVTTHDGKALTDTKGIGVGDRIEVRLADGRLLADVKEII